MRIKKCSRPGKFGVSLNIIIFPRKQCQISKKSKKHFLENFPRCANFYLKLFCLYMLSFILQQKNTTNLQKYGLWENSVSRILGCEKWLWFLWEFADNLPIIVKKNSRMTYPSKKWFWHHDQETFELSWNL